MTPELNAPVRQASWWNRNWKWVVPVGCLGPVICCLSFAGFMYFGVSKVIQGSGAYTTALARAASNRDVQDALGAPLTPGMGIQGSIKENNGTGNADFTAPIEGPKGKGTLRVVATGRGGKWDFSVMEVEVNGKTINLLKDGPNPDEEMPPPDDSPQPEPEDPAEDPDGD
ncbi:MAG: hypothetical protein JNM17_00065 [Archangium sp.]|nr:hypothetical protein [Archangium sp.]